MNYFWRSYQLLSKSGKDLEIIAIAIGFCALFVSAMMLAVWFVMMNTPTREDIRLAAVALVVGHLPYFMARSRL